MGEGEGGGVHDFRMKGCFVFHNCSFIIQFSKNVFFGVPRHISSHRFLLLPVCIDPDGTHKKYYCIKMERNKNEMINVYLVGKEMRKKIRKISFWKSYLISALFENKQFIFSLEKLEFWTISFILFSSHHFLFTFPN